VLFWKDTNYSFLGEEKSMSVSRIISILLFTVLVATGCSEQNRTVGEVDQSKEPEQAITQAVEETQQGPTEIAGVVMETEKGVSIVTDTDTYLVSGQDLSGMMGKRIKVTGTITEVEDTQVLEVMTVLPLE
jgi:hypothetical protein